MVVMILPVNRASDPGFDIENGLSAFDGNRKTDLDVKA